MLVPERIPPVRTVLFDLDGTLVDARPSILDSYRHAFWEVAGIDIDKTGFDEGEILPMRVAEVFRHFGVPELARTGAVAYDEYYRAKAYELTVPYESSRDALVKLGQAGIGWGVVTNKGRGRARNDLERLFGGHVDEMLCLVAAEDTAQRKPHPAPIHAGIKRARAGASTVAYVGDGPHDIQAAIAAGTIPIGAAYGYYAPDALRAAGAAAILDRPVDLLEVVSADGSPAEAALG